MNDQQPAPVGSSAAPVTTPAAGSETRDALPSARDVEARTGASGIPGHPDTFTLPTGLLAPHLDENGTCDCMCDRCVVVHNLDWGGGDIHNECICADCDVEACGLHDEEVSS